MHIFRSIRRSPRQYLIAAVAAVAVGVTMAMAWAVDPMDAVWMPKCGLKLLTGYDCPGCGATRALHAALHGDLAGALRYNFFLIVGLGYALAVACATLLPRLSRLRMAVTGKRAAWIYIVLFFGWWIARNLLGI